MDVVRVATYVGLGAASGSVMAMTFNIKDWGAIAIAGCTGTTLGTLYAFFGKPFTYVVSSWF